MEGRRWRELGHPLILRPSALSPLQLSALSSLHDPTHRSIHSPLTPRHLCSCYHSRACSGCCHHFLLPLLARLLFPFPAPVLFVDSHLALPLPSTLAMSIFGRLRALDVYRDIPKELSEPTSTGGVISIVAVLCLSFLLCSEFLSYLSGTVTHQLLIEQPHPIPTSASHEPGTSSAFVHSIDQSLSVAVHLNITFYHIPCVALGVEVQDLFGSLGWGSDKALVRLATDNDGRVKEGRVSQGISQDLNELQRHVGEGCQLFGRMAVESVPGNFHFLPGLSYQHLALFYPEHFINTSHTVHYLYFGDLTRKQLKHERIPLVMDSIHDHTRLVTEDQSAANREDHLKGGKRPGAAGSAPPPPSQFHFSKSFESLTQPPTSHHPTAVSDADLCPSCVRWL